MGCNPNFSYLTHIERKGYMMAVRVCCLYRVSTGKQVDYNAENQADIPMQRKACREFAKRNGWVIVLEMQEAGVSGFKVSANDRDVLQEIRERAENKEFDILLVFMFDRIGRRAEETPFVVEWFIQNGIRIWSVNEGEQRIDTHADRLMNYIRFWQADGESRKTSVRTKAALSQMVQEGRFRGGVAPYGYDLVPSGVLNKKKREVMKLKINESEAKVIRMIFHFSVENGYGRCKIGNLLTSMGIYTREGKAWHEATVGHILHNELYMGILKSGTTRSEVFPEFQIISPDYFEMAQKLMAERINERKETRTMPLNTTGQSLLSGNVFCGHCGGRLTLTTNGTVRTHADGTVEQRKRVRYVCYNKTRHRLDCDGQTGYTMHILDGIIVDVLHMIFDKMAEVTEDEIVCRAHDHATLDLKDRLTRAKEDFTKATKEYDSLKGEVVKAVQGKSAFSMDILSELVESAKKEMLASGERLNTLTAEMETDEKRISKIKSNYKNLIRWSEIFDNSDMATKKMIAGYIIHRVYVYSGYRLHIEFNMNIEQFLGGLDIPADIRLDKGA